MSTLTFSQRLYESMEEASFSFTSLTLLCAPMYLLLGVILITQFNYSLSPWYFITASSITIISLSAWHLTNKRINRLSMFSWYSSSVYQAPFMGTLILLEGQYSGISLVIFIMLMQSLLFLFVDWLLITLFGLFGILLAIGVYYLSHNSLPVWSNALFDIPILFCVMAIVFLFNLSIKRGIKMRLLAWIDAVSQIYSRLYLNDRLPTEWKRAERTKQMLSILMVDIDNFKLYNDQLGHPSGDDCLRTVAQLLKGALLRPADFVARYGGEEFMVVLPDTTEENALTIAKKLNKVVFNKGIDHPDSTFKRVTVSIGVASCLPTSDESLSTLISNADQGLYQAKKSGKNCSILFR